MTPMQCKDIPDRQVLEFLRTMRGGYCGAGWHDLQPREDFSPTVVDAMPPEIPRRLVLAKMKGLVARGLVDGCTCGCRGDFNLTEKGAAALTPKEAP